MREVELGKHCGNIWFCKRYSRILISKIWKRVCKKWNEVSRNYFVKLAVCYIQNKTDSIDIGVLRVRAKVSTPFCIRLLNISLKAPFSQMKLKAFSIFVVNWLRNWNSMNVNCMIVQTIDWKHYTTSPSGPHWISPHSVY